MLKTCPHCMTLVKVTDEQLANAGGSVTCTHCHLNFDIEPPTKATQPVPEITIEDDERTRFLEEEKDDTAPKTRIKNRPRFLPWFVFNLLLAMLLAGQYVYFKRDNLTEYPQLRPWLMIFCQYLQCDLKLIRDTQQIHIISREVKTHPTLKNTLQISMTFINDAPFRQPWPTISLAFSNLSGKTIAERAFTPGDYLSSPEQISRGLPTKEPFTADLLLIDPGDDAVNFIFDFL